MCGIAGMMTRNGRPPGEEVLKTLSAALAHRGPDGRGRYVSGNVGMVHTRLAIVDLETGDQPLYAATGDADDDDRDGWVALVGNGEIYNDLALRAEMGAALFATGSDCEAPLQLYLRHGDGFADHLRGMYAIAIHDPRHDSDEFPRLVLARDPFGIKPLYLAETAAGLAFASEPQALIAAGLVEPALLPDVRDELLQLQFTTGSRTPFRGIERVLPGETIVVEQGRIVDRRRRLALPTGAPIPIAQKEALDRLQAELRDSVGVHQRSDVPYAMFLSGGVDSSAVLSVMAELNDRPVLALTAWFPGSDAEDERERARAVAKTVGAEHVQVEFDEQDLWTLLPAVAACMDDPALDYATLPTYKLAAAARAAGIKVVLTGEGGDEIFAGYGRYRRALRSRLLGGRPMRARGTFDGLGVLRDGRSWRDGLAATDAAVADPERSPLQHLQAVDCADWLPNDLLNKLDRCLMAHGVEGRVPLLDCTLANFAFRLPDSLKVSGGLGKRLLRQWLDTACPPAEATARKRGFTVPVGTWIARRAAELGPLVAAQPGVAEACRPHAALGLFAKAEAGDRRAGKAAWALLFYALWHHRHILRRSPGADVFETLAS
ncbi:MAG: asparagine synthase (glutamine-hydrolyzing) [Rhodospirillales bacterium]|nr:asparagine synthase (glutamine-hydrolyzing) [Rhodospirillales bacterium]